MARGQKTGGRTKGTPNKATSRRITEILGSGETPLAYMLRVMRDKTQEHARRDEMAKSAAPYIHAKLAAVEHTGVDGGPIELENKAPEGDLDLARRIAFALESATRGSKG